MDHVNINILGYLLQLHSSYIKKTKVTCPWVQLNLHMHSQSAAAKAKVAEACWQCERWVTVGSLRTCECKCKCK